MSSNIRIDPIKFDETLKDILSDYTDEVAEAVSDAIEETAKDAKKEIRKYKTGATQWHDYPKGWQVKIEKGRMYTDATVYNRNHYQLTHLLEFGHAKRNGGRTRAFPHVKIVNDIAQEQVQRKIREKLS